MARGIWPIRKPCMLRSRMPISASAVFLRCSSSVSPNVSNRRVRTRTHGGVAGGGGGAPPPLRGGVGVVRKLGGESLLAARWRGRASDDAKGVAARGGAEEGRSKNARGWAKNR